jgi:hypothetical protein
MLRLYYGHAWGQVIDPSCKTCLFDILAKQSIPTRKILPFVPRVRSPLHGCCRKDGTPATFTQILCAWAGFNVGRYCRHRYHPQHMMWSVGQS